MTDEVPKLTVETTYNHVYFYATVDEDRCLALMRELRTMDGSLRSEQISRELPAEYPLVPIWLHVQSPGGFIFPAFAIAEQMKMIQSPIFTVVEGCVASAATIISLAGTRRFIVPNSFMLIHQLDGEAWGKYAEIQDEMALMDMLMERLVEYYASTTKMRRKELKALLQHDSWFSAEQCIEKGLADEMRRR